MIYDIRQVTTYHYVSSVAYARHVLRLTPIDRMGQRVHAAAVEIEPEPVERREGHDFFGNRMTWIELDQPHDTLSVRVAARVAVKRDIVVEASPAWEDVRDAAFASVDLSPNSPAHYVFASRQVSLDPEIRAYAAESFSPGRPVLDAAVDLMRRIKADFVYEIGATTASTTPPMSFALRRGVCQDFAHIMISGMRGLGLPAAYVSGYLRTAQSPNERGSRAPARCMPGCWWGAEMMSVGAGLIRPMAFSPATTMWCLPSAATTPMSRRSTASFLHRAASASKCR
jgi:transglutaminase-like putative cysteine protease